MGKAFLLLKLLWILQPSELEPERGGIEGNEEGGGMSATGSCVTRKAKAGKMKDGGTRLRAEPHCPLYTPVVEDFGGPGTVPGPSSGESIKVRHGCERVTGGRDETIPTTNGIRFAGIPLAVSLNLELAMSTLSEKEAHQRTATSMRVHWGRRIPSGIGLGNLRAGVNVKPNRFSARQKLTLRVEESLCSGTNRTSS